MLITAHIYKNTVMFTSFACVGSATHSSAVNVKVLLHKKRQSFITYLYYNRFYYILHTHTHTHTHAFDTGTCLNKNKLKKGSTGDLLHKVLDRGLA
jgi:hypothetical protein